MPTVRLTPAEAAELDHRTTIPVRPAAPVPRARGRTQRHTPGAMNKTEARYRDEVLEPARLAGGVLQYWFEAVTLKLADDCRFTGDFCVLCADLAVEIVDVKALWSNGRYAKDDSLVKLRVAADKFPLFRFVAAIWDKKAGWSRKEF